MLAPTLAELEAVRQDVGRRIRHRASWMTPLGAGGLLAAWAIYAVLNHDLNLLLPPVAVVVGAAAGHVVASSRLAGEYERLYRARVLPRLAALFGPLTFQRPPPPDLERLRRFHVFRHFDSARGEDAIVGQYRGVKISIEQLHLTRGWGLWRKQVFRGLLIEIELKNRLAGTTAVAADAGGFGNFRDELAARNIRRVGLESSAFEREYEVYGTDQVMARALITPDFMERFLRPREQRRLRPPAGAGAGQPVAAGDAAAGRTRRASQATTSRRRPTRTPASDDGVLSRLYHDIQAVLRAADSAIALDAPTIAQAKSPRRKPPAAKSGDDDTDALAEDPIGEDQ